jgi:L-galactose dehydrogenase
MWRLTSLIPPDHGPGYPLAVQKDIIMRFPGKLDTILTYCHYSMNDYSLSKELQWFKDRKLGIINASAISMGLLTHRGPPAWHPATVEVKRACADAAAYCQDHGVNISTLAMAFTLGNPDIPTTLVSTASLARITKNIAACTYQLTDKEKEVSAHVMETFFKSLNDTGKEHWEGAEVREHWNTIGARKEELINTRYADYLRSASPLAQRP